MYIFDLLSILTAKLGAGCPIGGDAGATVVALLIAAIAASDRPSFATP